MRRSSVVILLLTLALIWLVAVAYLAEMSTIRDSAPSTRIDVGISPIVESSRSGSFSLEDANSRVMSAQIDIINETSEKEIYYILGRNVDENGNATNWLYGVRHRLGTSLLLYDQSGWTVIPWNGVLPVEEIHPDAIFPLRTLFIINKDLLANNSTRAGSVRRQVEVINGTYRITISDDREMRVLMFNATSGALI